MNPIQKQNEVAEYGKSMKGATVMLAGAAGAVGMYTICYKARDMALNSVLDTTPQTPHLSYTQKQEVLASFSPPVHLDPAKVTMMGLTGMAVAGVAFVMVSHLGRLFYQNCAEALYGFMHKTYPKKTPQPRLQ